MAITQPIQQVQRVTLAGEQDVVFETASEAFIVKNFSDADIYVSFAESVDEATSIRILPLMGQTCVINAKADHTNPKSNRIRIKGTGEVEVQALQWQ